LLATQAVGNLAAEIEHRLLSEVDSMIEAEEARLLELDRR
jgi:hypothetical protein